MACKVCNYATAPGHDFCEDHGADDLPLPAPAVIAARRLTRVYVNPRAVKTNAEAGTTLETVVVDFADGRVVHCNGVKANGPWQLVYRPDDPSYSGARVYIETDSELEIFK